MEWHLTCPSNNLVVGPSGCGKTTFVEKLLKTPRAFDKPIQRVYYCYGIESDNIQRLARIRPDIQFVRGLPEHIDTPERMFDRNTNDLIIFDDLSAETQNSPEFTHLLTRATHHLNVCLISLEHFLFAQGKERKNQSAHYHQVVLFKNNRNTYQAAKMASMGGIDLNLFKFAYDDAVQSSQNPYGYLIVDFRNDTPKEMTLITNVFRENGPYVTVYAAEQEEKL